MNNRQESVVLAEADLRSVKELRRVLMRAGIESHILRPPGSGNT